MSSETNITKKSERIARNRPKRRWHIVILVLLVLSVALPGLSTLPVIDRDEARFSQASVQMAESGDLLNIRFQDKARNKKPAGIYWLQTAAIKTFSEEGKRTLWAQRVPSVLGALLAVLATYLAGIKLVGRQAALIGAGALSLSLLMVFEAHIAKTDAVLCGLAASCFAALAYIRATPSGLSLWKARPAVWVFWLAFGAAILIKGPVVPSIVALTCLTLLIWEKRGYGIRQLINIPAILVSCLMFIPWAVAIGLETQGAFFAESLGRDFGGKLVSAQESHPGPPGYHLLHINLTLWPATLLLLPGFALAFRTLRNDKNARKDNRPGAPLAKSIRLCLAWIIPFWLMIEIMPTKLPHYALPLFPAICLLVGLAGIAMMRVKDFGITRFISGFLFILAATAIIALLIVAQVIYSDVDNLLTTYIIAAVAGVIAIAAGFLLWVNRVKASLILAGLSALSLNILAYAFILPSLSDLRLADRVEAAFENASITLPRQSGPLVRALNFTEPSLVYRLGKEIRLGDQTDLTAADTWASGTIFIVDEIKNEGKDFAEFSKQVEAQSACIKERSTVSGFNYSKGDAVDLHIFEVINCESNLPNAQKVPL